MTRLLSNSRYSKSQACAAHDPAQRNLLQRTAAAARPVNSIPTIAQDVLHTPGQPLDAKTRSFMEPRFGHDFGQVRVHADAQAGQAASAVNALAYTRGNQIVFATGQYAPGSNAGDRLMAHELTHVVQQSRQPIGPASAISQPGDTQEREADYAAETISSGGQAQSAIRAGAASALIQRQPAKAGAFSNETPTETTRRTAAIGALRIAFQRLNTGLTSGFLWSFETVTPNGIDLTPIGSSLSPEAEAARATRLKGLLSQLTTLISDLESAPVPANFLTSPVQFPTGTYAVTGGTQPWQDAQMFYAHRNVGLGFAIATTNVFYIETAPLPTKKLKGVAMATGIQTGNFIVVPNPDTEPLVYHRLGHEGAWNSGEEAIEVWHDELGYYYLGKDGSKHYLPNWPN